METHDLYNFTLLILLIGMIVGAGVLALDKFGIAAKEDTGVIESLAFTAGVAATSNDDVTSLSYITNGTTKFSGVNLTIPLTNFTVAGAVYTDAIFDGTYNLSYNYDADSASTTTIFAGRDAVGEVSTVWLGLIVTIGILAIIIVLIVRSFGDAVMGR